MRAVAIVDDNRRLHGHALQGVPIVGDIDLLPQLLHRQAATLVLLAIARADREMVRRVAELADGAGAALKVLPRVEEVVDGKVTVRDVRDVSIEDLLGRQQVATDLDAVSGLLRGKRVLITGAGGSIGSEIVRQVAAFEPEQLLMLDNDETHLHDAAHGLSMAPVQLLADIRDRTRLNRIFREWQPQVVFHAAALKHVPMLEANPTEAVRTNVIGTANVVDASSEVGVERFVFISTDKAVEPTSVMGASKRIGEHLVLNQTNGHRYTAVRFGNVLGSRGSVVPTFARQISSGQPVTVTDERMTRFFMSTPEAVQLVLQAAAIAHGGDVLMLDMGEPVNIHDLAEKMIRLSGRQPGRDVEIRVTGMRPGEKLHEQLRAPAETPHPTSHSSIVRIFPEEMARPALATLLGELVKTADDGRERDAASMLLSAAHGGEKRRATCQKAQQRILDGYAGEAFGPAADAGDALEPAVNVEA
jgi:FlaA1/EpsC-like NDP-sugar epimerase